MKPPQKLIPILLAAGLLSGGTALAGSFTTDFSSLSGFSLEMSTMGTPSWDTYPLLATNRVILTPAVANYGGGVVIWDLDAAQPIESFVATFQLQLGPGSGNPADGVSFNFGPNVVDIGTVNYAEEGPGGQCLTISFDTYDNGLAAEQVPTPDVDIQFQGKVIASKSFAKSDMVTGQLENVRVELKADGRVTVTYKGQVILNNVFVPGWAPTAGLFGFAARCGGEYEYQAIANLSINTVLQGTTPVLPTFLANPLSASVPEGGSTNFSVSVDGTAPFTFQWTKNGTDIAGATTPTLAVGPVYYSTDNNSQYVCRVTDPAGTATSSAAVLTVIKDTTPPTVVKVAANTSGTEILVTFSEPVSQTTATLTSNYRLSMGGTDVPLSFVNQVNPTTVDIFVYNPIPQGREFTLTINGVQDLATSPPNTIAANTQVTFRSFLFQAGAVLHKKYMNLANDISSFAGLQADPRYPSLPDRQDILSMFEYPANGAGRDDVADPTGYNGTQNTILYSDTLECLFTAPTTGDYVFWAGGADINDVFLSTDDQPANMQHIAQCSGWTNPRDWNVSQCGTTNGLRSDWYTANNWPGAGSPSLGQAFIHLEQGSNYYLLAFHHRFTWSGGDDFAVTYTMAAASAPAGGSAPVLTGNVVGTFLDPTGANVNFVQQPTNTTILQGRTATFFVQATGQSAYGTNVTLQWQTAPAGGTTFTNIPGATSASFTTGAMPLSENGRKYQVVGTVPGFSVTSSSATLAVIADTVPPHVVSASALPSQSGNTFDVGITFDEPVIGQSAQTLGNYTVSAGTISAVKYYARSPGVVLTVSGLTIGSSYTVNVTGGVSDPYGNIIAPVSMPFTVSSLQWGVVGADQLKLGNGVVAVSTNSFDIYSDGVAEWGTYDEATFVYEQINGDFDKEVRVEYQDASSQWARAGLIARDVTNFGVDSTGQATSAARYQKVHVNPVLTAMGTPGNNAYEGNRRLTTGGPTTTASISNGSNPAYPNAWCRLQRVGQTFNLFRSSDGVTWTQIGTSTFDGTLPTSLYVGLDYSPENGNVSPASLQSMWVAKYRDYRTHSSVVPPPVMTFQRTSTGMTVTYEAGSTLQWAPTPAGAWTDLTGAANPYIVPIDNQPKFYRAKK